MRPLVWLAMAHDRLVGAAVFLVSVIAGTVVMWLLRDSGWFLQLLLGCVTIVVARFIMDDIRPRPGELLFIFSKRGGADEGRPV